MQTSANDHLDEPKALAGFHPRQRKWLCYNGFRVQNYVETQGNWNTMAINHGTNRRYSDGCRCDECREAHKLKAREYRDRSGAA
jgi:hypothetical protein